MKRFRGFVMGIMASSSFGFLPLFTIPLMSEGMATNAILAYRLLIAALAMALIMLVRGQRLKVSGREFVELAVLSVWYFFSALLLFSGYKHMSSGLATVIHFSYPIFTTLIMALFYRQYISPVTIMAMVLAIGGVMLSIGIWGQGVVAPVFYIIIVVLSGLAYALYMVMVNNRPLLRDMTNQRLTFYAMLLCGIYFLIYSLCTNTMSVPTQPRSWVYLLLLALICTLLSNITLVEALKSVGATLGAVLGAVEPLTAVVLGVLFLGEQIDTQNVIGMVMIVLSVVLIVLSPVIDWHVNQRLLRFERNSSHRH